MTGRSIVSPRAARFALSVVALTVALFVGGVSGCSKDPAPVAPAGSLGTFSVDQQSAIYQAALAEAIEAQTRAQQAVPTKILRRAAVVPNTRGEIDVAAGPIDPFVLDRLRDVNKVEIVDTPLPNTVIFGPIRGNPDAVLVGVALYQDHGATFSLERDSKAGSWKYRGISGSQWSYNIESTTPGSSPPGSPPR